jgi:hypothetical protein
VLRGGGYRSNANTSYCTASYRDSSNPSNGDKNDYYNGLGYVNYVGFRLVSTLSK